MKKPPSKARKPQRGHGKWTQHNPRKRGPKLKVSVSPEPLGPDRGDVETMRSESLAPIVRDAHALRSKGLYLHEVSTILAQEHGIKPPSEATIYRWAREAQEAYLADIKGFRAQYTMLLLEQNERLCRKYLPIAVADELAITRFRKEDGEVIAFTDENAFMEQSKAAEIVIKCSLARMELLGLKGGEGITEKEDGEQTLSSLFAYIGKMAAQRTVAPHDGDLSNLKPVLELKSGFEDIYNTNEQAD